MKTELFKIIEVPRLKEVNFDSLIPIADSDLGTLIYSQHDDAIYFLYRKNSPYNSNYQISFVTKCDTKKEYFDLIILFNWYALNKTARKPIRLYSQEHKVFSFQAMWELYIAKKNINVVIEQIQKFFYKDNFQTELKPIWNDGNLFLQIPLLDRFDKEIESKQLLQLLSKLLNYLTNHHVGVACHLTVDGGKSIKNVQKDSCVINLYLKHNVVIKQIELELQPICDNYHLLIELLLDDYVASRPMSKVIEFAFYSYAQNYNANPDCLAPYLEKLYLHYSHLTKSVEELISVLEAMLKFTKPYQNYTKFYDKLSYQIANIIKIFINEDQIKNSKQLRDVWIQVGLEMGEAHAQSDADAKRLMAYFAQLTMEEITVHENKDEDHNEQAAASSAQDGRVVETQGAKEDVNNHINLPLVSLSGVATELQNPEQDMINKDEVIQQQTQQLAKQEQQLKEQAQQLARQEAQLKEQAQQLAAQIQPSSLQLTNQEQQLKEQMLMQLKQQAQYIKELEQQNQQLAQQLKHLQSQLDLDFFKNPMDNLPSPPMSPPPHLSIFSAVTTEENATNTNTNARAAETNATINQPNKKSKIERWY